MARRTKTYEIIPWVGGINTSVDPGVLNSQELVQADNVVFSSTGARIKRNALQDLLNAIPAPVTRSSSGTTRTLVFAADDLVTTLPANEKLVVGEKITVRGDGFTTYDATDVAILSRNNLGGGVYSITYTGGSSLSESSTAAGTIVITRTSSVISVTDYWYFASGETNSRLLMYATDDFQLFSMDDSGRRQQIHGQEQVTKVVAAAASTLTTGDYFLINGPNNNTLYYVWFNKASGGGNPAPSGRTGIEVAIGGSDTDAQVASAINTAINTSGYFTSTVLTNTVTITALTAGTSEEATDVNTAFAITTEKFGATMPESTLSQVCTGVMNERFIMAFNGIGNLPIKYNPEENSGKYQLLFNGPDAGPDMSFFFFHLSRMWSNDKTQRDYLHYCETFDETVWMGYGDSGALPVFPGDGDPEGIVCGYKYKGFAVVGKKAKRYRVLGFAPEEFAIESISDGLGNEGPLAIPVDESDVVFVSRRGLHSQQTTDQYGDTDAAYLSADIKPTFNEWEKERLKYMQGTYIPELNSIAVSVSEDGNNTPNAVWLYNIEVEVPGKPRKGAWYRWPDISCTSLSRRFINGGYKLIFGTSDGRIVEAQKENDFTDFGVDGIPFKIKTGTIYPGNDPHSVKAFKKISMIYRPKGNFVFTVKATIDNNKSQSFSFNQVTGLDLLGDTFILGSSTLGSSAILAPTTFSMEGYGRGVTLEISQPSADEQVEIWGFVIEYESADLRQSTDEEASAE